MGSSIVVAAMAFALSAGAARGQIDSVSQFFCNPNSLNSRSTTTCTVTLSGTAPADGTVVLLSSNNALLPVLVSVIVPPGAFATTFTATAGIISSNQNVTFTAIALNSVLLTWTASVSPDVTNYNVYRATSSGGPYSMVATLGIVTSYTDYNVQNGQIYYYVTTAVNNNGEQSAFSNQAWVAVPGEVTEAATVSLVAPAAPVTLFSLACNTSSLSSGAATTCTVTLSNVAPSGGTVVSLSSNNALLPVPVASVTVPAGTTSTTFTATAATIAMNQSATLTATLSGLSRTATVSLVAPVAQVTLSSLACKPSSLNSGAATTCTVTLGNVAPSGGTVVSLSSNNALLPVPAASITVPAETTSTTFAAAAGTIASNQSATVTATLSGVSQTATVRLMARRRPRPPLHQPPERF